MADDKHWVLGSATGDGVPPSINRYRPRSSVGLDYYQWWVQEKEPLRGGGGGGGLGG